MLEEEEEEIVVVAKVERTRLVLEGTCVETPDGGVNSNSSDVCWLFVDELILDGLPGGAEVLLVGTLSLDKV